MIDLRSINKCRACGNANLISVGNLGDLALTGIFPKTAEQVVPRGRLELVKCFNNDKARCCGLLQLKHSFNPSILFADGYGYRSGLNAAIKGHLQGIAQKIIDLNMLKKGDVVVDIGSNDGTLLQFFSAQDFQLLGIDPTANQFKQQYPKDAGIAADFFSKELVQQKIGTRKAKVVTGIAVFYDVEEPLQFLIDVRDILAHDGICFLEQGYLPTVLKNNAYDTVCHEHLTYFGLAQIKWMADRAGLKIIDCGLSEMNGGSFFVILAHKDSAYSEAVEDIKRFLKEEDDALLFTLKPYQDFFTRINNHRADLLDVMAKLRADHLSIAGYGASTKGNVLLQFCGLTPNEIPFVADINADKWGSFCPGTGIPIISEEQAMANPPDVFLVLPWHLKAGFLLKEKRYLDQGGKFLLPLPRISLISK